MQTVSIDNSGKEQTVFLPPPDLAYENVEELEISRDGDVITLRPIRPSWTSFSELPKADDQFLQERPLVIFNEEHQERE